MAADNQVKVQGFQFPTTTPALDEVFDVLAVGRLPRCLRFSFLALFLLVALSTACTTEADVKVELKEWAVNVTPSAVEPVNCINFNITNTGSLPHEFVVTESIPYDPSWEGGSGPVIPAFEPDELPVENGRVRYYTIIGEEPYLTFRPDGGWSIGGGSPSKIETSGVWSIEGTRGGSPPEIDPSLYPWILVAPGDMDSFQLCLNEGWPPGTTFIVFSNQPGDYQQGMYTTLRVE